MGIEGISTAWAGAGVYSSPFWQRWALVQLRADLEPVSSSVQIGRWPHQAEENEFYRYTRFDKASLENKELSSKSLPEQVPLITAFQVKNNNQNLCSNFHPTVQGISLIDVLLGQKLSTAKSCLSHLLVPHLPLRDVKVKAVHSLTRSWWSNTY